MTDSYDLSDRQARAEGGPGDPDEEIDETFSEGDFIESLTELLAESRDNADDFGSAFIDSTEIDDVRSFSEAGLLTGNVGLVVRLANGQEFQITIVESTRR